MNRRSLKTVTLGLVLALANLVSGAEDSFATEVDRLIEEISRYHAGDSMVAVRRLEALAQTAETNRTVRAELQGKLPKLLVPSTTLEAKRFACKQLGVIGSERALPAIAPLLRDPVSAGFACLALSTYPPGQADKILRAALPNTSGRTRIQIIQTIGDRQDVKAVPLLANLAHGSDLSEAAAAITALGKIGASARKTLEDLDKVPTMELTGVLMEAEGRVAENLAASGKRKAATEIYESLIMPSRPDSVRRGAFGALLALDHDYGERRILQYMQSSDEVLRPLAIAAVRRLPGNRSSEIFASVMPKLGPTEQVWLIESLTTRADTPARRIILTCLQSEEAVVRISAARALVDIGDSKCALPLTQALTNAKDSEEIQVVQRALGGLPGGSQTDRIVLDQLQNAQGQTRARIISSLIGRSGPQVLKAVFAETDNPDLAVATAAYQALGRMATDDGLLDLLNKFASLTNNALYSPAAESTRNAVVATDEPIKRSRVVKAALAHCQDIEIRCALLQLLPLCGNADALDTLRAAALDSNSRVRDAVVRALADWPDPSVEKDLYAILQKPESEVHRSLAFRALVRQLSESNQGTDGQLPQHYRDLLQATRSDEELRLILGALGGLAQPFALDLALSLVDKPSVHAEAEAAVKRIAETIKTSDPRAAAQALSKLGLKD